MNEIVIRLRYNFMFIIGIVFELLAAYLVLVEKVEMWTTYSLIFVLMVAGAGMMGWGWAEMQHS